MSLRTFRNGTIILADRLVPNGVIQTRGERIVALDERSSAAPDETIDLDGGYLSPGLIDLHVHGGDGADFMDGDAAAFATVCRAHARHGTTALTPTTTVARHDQHLRFFELCQHYMMHPTGGAKVLGGHLYGPYFAEAARGCHPGASVRPPALDDYHAYFAFGAALRTATVAPELDGAERFVRACRERGIHCNIGHSHATFEQVQAAVTWGVRHVDHLFCAMSDRARLRQSQTYPMRAGVMEATLYFDELTTEVIADGKHLTAGLLQLAYKVKGPDRLALVTDANRALGMPDGEYWFGPADGGERILKRDGVGLMPDGQSLASGVVGMDHAVRTFHHLTGVPLYEVIRMASLTPARIIGADTEIGSITVGKYADLIEWNRDLTIRAVWINGQRL